MKVIYNNNEIKIKKCTNFKDRLIGLMLKKDIDYGLFFPKCSSIHTFFMRFNIDVYMVDKNYKIISIKKNMKPWKILLPKKNVYGILEFKANTTKFKINEKIF